MITSISLENWRSHQSTSLSFRKGTNLLVGVMGSGKSSVLDAMSFALFGNFPALEHKKISLAEVIRHQKEKAKVKLGLEWKKEKYEIARELRSIPGKETISTDAEVRKEGKLVEKGQKAVTKYVEQLLQIDYGLFSRAIYSEQNGIDRFLSFDPRTRKQEMDELLGLDRFESARANVVKIINSRKALEKELRAKFSAERLAEVRKREKDAQEKVASLNAEAEDARKLGEQAKKELGAAESLFSGLKEKKGKADALKESISILKGAIANISDEIEGKQIDEGHLREAEAAMEFAEKEMKKAEEKMEQLQKRQNKALIDAQTLENKLADAEKEKAELEAAEKELERLLGGRKARELENEKEKMEKECLEIAAGAQALRLEIEKLEEGMKKLQGRAISRCPVCRCQLTADGIAHVLKEYELEIGEKRAHADSLWKQWKEKDAELRKTGLILHRVQALGQRVSLLQGCVLRYEEISKKLPKARKEAESAGAEVKSAREKSEKLKKGFQEAREKFRALSELAAKKKRLEQMKEELGKSEAALKALEFSEKDYEGARLALAQALLQSEKQIMRLKSIEKETKSAAELLSLAAEARKELESVEKEIAKLEKMGEELSIYKNALVETQALLRSEVVDAINTAMNEAWGIIYPYADYKGVRMVASEKGYEFEIYDGEWRPAGLASGGERASIALALRMALATVLTPNISMLVLDEPTHNLDKEAVSLLAHALQYNLPEFVEQSFVITHEEGLMGSEFASTYRMKRDKEVNGPTEVEEM